MFVTTGHEIAFLITTLVAFGSWPALRRCSGLPFPQFAFFSIVAQFTLAVAWLASLGTQTGNGAWLDNERSSQTFVQIGNDPLFSGAVILGGFLLGHSDMINSWAMQFLPAGVSFAFYGCTSLVGSSILNLCIQGSARLSLLLLAIVLALLGKVLLAVAIASARFTVKDNCSAAEIGHDLVAQPLDANSHSHHPEGRLPPLQLHRSNAMIVCVGAGVLASCWSPLSTFARNSGTPTIAVRNPYVCLLLFAFGELCALPSLLLGAHFIVREPVFKPLKLRQAAFAVLSGSGVSLGYLCYYLASTGVPAAVAFGIGPASAPLVAILLDLLNGEFRRTPPRGKVVLCLCILSFGGAIATMASIA